MSVPVLDPRPAGALRVAIVASDPVRGAGLAAIVAGAGHAVVRSPDDAEIVLADMVVPEAENGTVVTLGVGEAGQAGLLPRDASPRQIDAALRAAAAGLAVRIAGSRPPRFRASPDEDAPLLTPREVEVLAAIGDGLSNKAAARRLGISQHTVKFHLELLFRKLAATSRAEAVHKGLRRGLIEL